MASQQQIDANRRNARRSTGPKTPEGKAIVSRNAIRHGLTSTRAIALPEENLEEFNDLLESFSAQFQPQSPFERSLVLQMAVADWRMRRAVRLETGILAYRLDEMRAERDIPLSKPDPASSRADRKFDEDTRLLGELFSRNCEGYPQLTLLRYENSARRAYYNALRELRLVQSHRRDQTNPIPPSAPPREPLASPSAPSAPSARNPYGTQATSSISTRVASSGNVTPKADLAGAFLGKNCP